jgi:very-short-patch-repair endonuclease
LNQAALIPQAYLHYDPYTRRAGGTLLRQRMDFLMLLPPRRRVVLEIDGIQHCATEDGRADTRQYAQMVSADRELQLAGYKVYRFGGQVLVDRDAAAAVIDDFFNELLQQ